MSTENLKLIMAPTPGSEILRHFLLPLSILDENFDALPTNREVLGHLYGMYIDRCRSDYRAPMKKYFPKTILLLTKIWQGHGRLVVTRNAIDRRLAALLSRYKKDLDKSKKVDINFDYLYEVFGLEQNVRTVENIERVVDGIDDISLGEDAGNDIEKEDGDPDFVPEEAESDDSGEARGNIIPQQSRRLNIDNICEIADRRNLSSRDTALVISSTLEALGLIDKDKREMVVDRSKVEYARRKLRSKVMHNVTTSPLHCIQFDGKACNNLEVLEKVTKTGRRRKVVGRDVNMDNIIIVKQPNDELLGFVACRNADAASIFQNMVAFFHDKGISLQSVFALGCDGAAVNTGKNKGIIPRFEAFLNKPLHWLICILHLNERAFNNVVAKVDGKTTGPATHTGDVMRAAPTSHLRPPVKFEPISLGDINHEVDCTNFTNDQKYLWNIALMIDKGEIDEDLCSLCPGPIHNARWMTTVSRILRLYCTYKHPSKNLKLLANYAMKVYIPTWLETKYQHNWYSGACHLFELVKRTRTHVPKLLSCIKECVTFNSYFAHPENVLLAMIADKNKNIRRIGYTKILESRRTVRNGVRVFEKPSKSQLNFQSDSYHEFIIWDKIEIFEPPFTQQFATGDLAKLMDSDHIIALPSIPLHTQACEYYIQGLSESVKAVAGHSNQEGHLKNKMMSRARMGVFHTKKNFMCKR